jgi:hypothetical protein
MIPQNWSLISRKEVQNAAIGYIRGIVQSWTRWFSRWHTGNRKRLKTFVSSLGVRSNAVRGCPFDYRLILLSHPVYGEVL